MESYALKLKKIVPKYDVILYYTLIFRVCLKFLKQIKFILENWNHMPTTGGEFGRLKAASYVVI